LIEITLKSTFWGGNGKNNMMVINGIRIVFCLEIIHETTNEAILEANDCLFS
jgi:hypothetical protein